MLQWSCLTISGTIVNYKPAEPSADGKYTVIDDAPREHKMSVYYQMLQDKGFVRGLAQDMIRDPRGIERLKAEYLSRDKRLADEFSQDKKSAEDKLNAKKESEGRYR